MRPLKGKFGFIEKARDPGRRSHQDLCGTRNLGGVNGHQEFMRKIRVGYQYPGKIVASGSGAQKEISTHK